VQCTRCFPTLVTKTNLIPAGKIARRDAVRPYLDQLGL
jgi:hypothetical protein